MKKFPRPLNSQQILKRFVAFDSEILKPATPPDIKKEIEEARASEAVKTEPPEEPPVIPVEVKPEPPPMPPSSPPSPPKEAPPSGPSPGRSPKVKKESTQDMDMDSSDD